ncbi:hypothetical protein [Brucella anthropi]|uniref:hypothetical protein n=1 Tax=Brucella anthropi TaxID=529 RepID=UPI0032091364
MAEENNSGLTASEQAYFESGGETEVIETVATEPTAETPVQEVEQPVTEQPTSQERDEKGRFVPHQALHAEREEHKKTKAELEQIRQQQAILNDRWNTLLTAKQQTEQQTEETPPDPETDIIGYMKWQAQQNQKLQEKITNSEKQREQQQRAEQQERTIWDTWSNSVAQAKSSKPDFDKATEYLSSLRDKQLSAFGAANPEFKNPQVRIQQINAELRGIIIEAKQQGRDPADVVYEIAQGFGYAPASAPTPDPQQETIDRIAKIDEAQRASKTLNQSNGTNSGDPLSAEAIASMPPREFEAWIKDPANEKRFNALMGG